MKNLIIIAFFKQLNIYDMKNILFINLLLFLWSCQPKTEVMNTNINETKVNDSLPQLSIEQANRLAQLPLKCMSTKYPNKPGNVLGSADDLQLPVDMHPAFYGCFDWHSAVHGHWSLVFLLNNFPDLANKDSIISELQTHISEDNIIKEVAYFDGVNNKLFERTYGWAWLLQLANELHKSKEPYAKELEQNLQPLTDRIVNLYEEFLPKLRYPIRVGTHDNTAFGLAFAYDYAVALQNDSLKNIIIKKAYEFYLHDKNCGLEWEPGGYDFLSPCLEEADLMRRVLNHDEFITWFKLFLPQLTTPDFKLAPGIVSDRKDGLMVHLDGVNFSRAWCLYGIANNFNEYAYLKTTANEHINYSLGSITDGNYEGGHWLASFALYALSKENSK
jgi:hypothetical protein